MERNSVVRKRRIDMMKETLIDVETGEVLNVNIEGIYKLTPGQHKRINDDWRKTVIKTFSNTDKKKYLIGEKRP